MWGKFMASIRLGYPVLFHMLDVAAVAGQLWDRFLTAPQRNLIAVGLGLEEAQARSVVMFWAGAHDVGKVSRFQECEPVAWARVSDALRSDTGRWRLLRHERASMHAMVQILAQFGYPCAGNASPAVRAAQIMGGHHGWFHQVDVQGAASAGRVAVELGGVAWQDLRFRYAAQIQYLTGATAVPSQVSAPAAVLIAGLVMVADQLASQPHEWMKQAFTPRFGAAQHYEDATGRGLSRAGRGWAARVVDTAELERIELPPANFSTVHAPLTRPNELQHSLMQGLDAAVAEHGSGIVFVADRTGAGKTVTALEAQAVFARHLGTRGVAFLQPSTTIADAMYDTLTAYVAAHRPARAPTSLAHSHSWVNPAYSDEALSHSGQITVDDYFTDRPDPTGRPDARVTVPDTFLRGSDRALLAQFTVATLDQAAMAVMPTRRSALRLLGLSGRTVVLDEAHAYSPYTLRLAQRLLHWLGALGCPVVVLSATLPDDLASSLTNAYLAGAGHPSTTISEHDAAPGYPGWVFTAARSATAVRIEDSVRLRHASQQRSTATLELHDVEHQPFGAGTRPVSTGERLARILDEAGPVAEHGGCASIHCDTVADSQDTYRYLRHALDGTDLRAGTDLLLAHARLPGHQLDPLMRFLRQRIGPSGHHRPQRLIVVTTSLLEMSLNIDLDHVISDLAALPRLLHRLGRLWRFEQTWQHRGSGRPKRPDWIRERGPHMSVLHPTEDGCTLLPERRSRGDSDFLLHRTAQLLRTGRTLTLPDDVPTLLTQASSPDTSEDAEDLTELYDAHQAHARSAILYADMQSVPPPERIASLADLHRRPTLPGKAPTRDGERAQRLLPCFQQPSGRLTLDRHGQLSLPPGPRLKGAEIRLLLNHVISVPAAWMSGPPGQDTPPPPTAWTTHPFLADLKLLADDPHQPRPSTFGSDALQMDPELGLVRTRTLP
ncbi:MULTISPECIES: HD domain-containing protein [unclassified Streptomyces]|uniref:HD domain-containing protein n=2 Tax=unclassified Streptomyces TaxID=2593676 RepID=UPI002E180E9C|nr:MULTISPECIES: HD domain-containing protein [unclassified Streptomyces]